MADQDKAAKAALEESRATLLLDRLAQSQVCERLGHQFAGGVKQVVKKFEKEWPKPEENAGMPEDLLKKCESTLVLMAHVRDIFRAAEQIYRVFLPRTLVLQRDGSPPETFGVEGLDSEGRPIYRLKGGAGVPAGQAYLRWHTTDKGGLWAAHTDADGKEPGDFHLDSPLPIDAGVWQVAETGEPAKDVTCVCDDKPVLEPKVAEALAHCWEGDRQVAEVCRASAEVLSTSALGQAKVNSGETVLQVLVRLMEAMCSVVERLEIGKPLRPQDAAWPEFFASLLSLSSFSDCSVWPKMGAAMPGFAPDYELTWVQCMVYMCRVLDVSDIRLPSASWLMRLCNRCFLRSWQDRNPTKARIVDLQGRKATVEDPRPKAADSLRFVAVSDTHGWDHDLRLPEGDVLLHCGDLLFEGSALGQDGGVPGDLQAVLNVFHRPWYQRYKWIFLIGGNHDRSLHELWAGSEAVLAEKLPKNLVLLQVPADLKPALKGTCLTRDSQESEKAEDGAIKILPNFSLARPSDPRPGWVIVGSGVSLANNAWSANRAFQLIKDDTEALAQAAKVLTKHKPDVVMTHGPPKGHCDKGRGDQALAEAVSQCPSVKVHIFGHVHETYGTDFSDGDGPCWINASMSSPLYVAAAEPVIFDLPAPAGAVTAEERRLAQDSRLLRIRGLPRSTTPWEIHEHFSGFLVATVLPPSALAGCDEARAFFELPQHASEALVQLRGKPFGKSRVPVTLEAINWDTISTEANKQKKWVCLFDTINRKGDGFITPEELRAAREAKILPEGRVYGTGPLI